jgi:hypothetical protein
MSIRGFRTPANLWHDTFGWSQAEIKDVRVKDRSDHWPGDRRSRRALRTAALSRQCRNPPRSCRCSRNTRKHDEYGDLRSRVTSAAADHREDREKRDRKNEAQRQCATVPPQRSQRGLIIAGITRATPFRSVAGTQIPGSVGEATHRAPRDLG